MGAINSKRKSSWKGIKKKMARKKQTTNAQDEPIYEEIGINRDDEERNASDDNYVSASSLDSAFYERNSNPSRRSNSSASFQYDEPDESVRIPQRFAHLYECYHQLGNYRRGVDEFDNVIDDSNYEDDDEHTYVSEMSFRETDSESTSLKKYVPTNGSNFCKPYLTSVSLDEVPYMVEAFQPLLELTIDVMEVIPHLPFIDAHEFIGDEDAKTKVSLLISRITSCDEAGKWQSFLHALNQAEYQYIVSLLRGETEVDHSVNRNLLRLFTPRIMRRVDPEEFIDHLFEKGVINQRDMEEVRCEKDRRGAIAASFMLLHKVPRRVSNWYAVFLNVLEKCGMEDLIPEFDIPEISFVTKVEEKNQSSDENKYYLTPTYENDNEEPPQRKFHLSQTLNGEPVKKSIPTRSRASRKLPRPPVRVSPVIVQPHSRPKSEIELLKEKKDALQKEIEEKRLIRLYKSKVKLLQMELEKLNNSDETDQEDDETQSAGKRLAEQVVDDETNGNVETVIETEDSKKKADVERIAEQTDQLSDTEYVQNDLNKPQPTDTELVQNDLNNELDNMNESNVESGNIEADQMEHLTALFTDMKQEFKTEILAMRDHVTETVLKSVIGLISGSASTKENSYVTIGDEQTILPHKMQLYNSSNNYIRGLLTPRSHVMQRGISVDSAMFSDLSYVSRPYIAPSYD